MEQTKKRIIAGLLLAGMVLSLGACGNGENKENNKKYSEDNAMVTEEYDELNDFYNGNWDELTDKLVVIKFENKENIVYPVLTKEEYGIGLYYDADKVEYRIDENNLLYVGNTMLYLPDSYSIESYENTVNKNINDVETSIHKKL